MKPSGYEPKHFSPSKVSTWLGYKLMVNHSVLFSGCGWKASTVPRQSTGHPSHKPSVPGSVRDTVECSCSSLKVLWIKCHYMYFYQLH